MRELFRENPFGRISFLDMRYMDQDGVGTCIATLEFGRDEITVDSVDYHVGFLRAVLILTSPGFRQIPETRFGAIERESFTSIASHFSQERTLSGTAGIEGAIDPAKGIASAAVKTSTEVKAIRSVKDTVTLDDKIYRIRPRGEGMWDINEIDGKPLQGNYILGKALVQLRPVSGTNRKAVRAIVLAKQKDMTFEPDDKPIFPRFGVKEKLIKILAAKCMAKKIAPDQEYDGKFLLSLSEISDEGV